MQPTMQQLDIFADSRDVMLRNAVLDELQRRDGDGARAALAQLAAEFPDDGALPAMRVLVRELEREPERASARAFADHAALAVARRHLEEEVVPAARRVLPAQTVCAWLTPCWSSLATRHRCGCARAGGRRRVMRSTASSRGGASRHPLHG